jgi:aspartate/glutamate racemase
MNNDLPKAVQTVIDIFSRKGVWCRIGRNFGKEKALTCPQAVQIRQRLGKVGIPLSDELKSFLGHFETKDGQIYLCAAHCRADRQRDYERLAALLDTEANLIVELDDPEMAALGLELGIVNPFLLSSVLSLATPFTINGKTIAGIVQVVDSDVFDCRFSPTRTSMTNAGDFYHSVEFSPIDLPVLLPDLVVGKFSIPNPDPQIASLSRVRLRKLGIVTGNPPEAGFEFINLVNAHIRNQLKGAYVGDLSMPPLSIESCPETGLSMELSERKVMVFEAVVSGIKRLHQSGAEVVAIPCNTLAYFTSRLRPICEGLGMTFVGMPDACRRELDRLEVTSVAMLGIPAVVDFELGLSGYSQAFAGIHCEVPEQSVLDEIFQLAHAVKSKGSKKNNSAVNKFETILKKHVRNHTVILALTELSLLFAERGREGRIKNLIDPLLLYANDVGDHLIETVDIQLPQKAFFETYGDHSAL